MRHVAAVGKPYFPAGGKAKRLEDRQMPDQPIVFAGDRDIGRHLNRRKLRELPHQLLQLADWKRFVDVCLRLEFIEARFDYTRRCFHTFIWIGEKRKGDVEREAKRRKNRSKFDSSLRILRISHYDYISLKSISADLLYICQSGNSQQIVYNKTAK